MANTNQHSPRLLLCKGQPLQGGCRMTKRCLIAVAALALLVPSLAMGQQAVVGQEDDNAEMGRVWRNYVVRQSLEIGGRISEVSGNQQMYDTLVNLQSGPRLLGQELSMQPTTRGGGLFDNLYPSSFDSAVTQTTWPGCGSRRASGITSSLSTGAIRTSSITTCLRIR